jgi:hypothetical protein
MAYHTTLKLPEHDIRIITKALRHSYKYLQKSNMPLTAEIVSETLGRFLEEITRLKTVEKRS